MSNAVNRRLFSEKKVFLSKKFQLSALSDLQDAIEEAQRVLKNSPRIDAGMIGTFNSEMNQFEDLLLELRKLRDSLDSDYSGVLLELESVEDVAEELIEARNELSKSLDKFEKMAKELGIKPEESPSFNIAERLREETMENVNDYQDIRDQLEGLVDDYNLNVEGAKI